jgi:hypothetical protein
MKQGSREAIAGSALGLLVGALVGLSTSPVAANFLGAMTALLVAFFGLRGTGGAAEREPVDASANVAGGIRIATFSLACLVAILVSLAVRTHDLLSPSAQSQVLRWTSAGYSPQEARQFAAYKMLGVLPDHATVGAPAANASSSVLFGVTADECRQLDPSSFANVNEVINALQLAKGRWQQLGNALEQLPDANRAAMAKASWELVCR